MFGMMFGRMGSILSGGFVQPFSPSSLFGLGQSGAWWEPSDFRTVYQDAAGSIPVTGADQPVALMLDKRLALVRGPQLVNGQTWGSMGVGAVGGVNNVTFVAATAGSGGTSEMLTAGKFYIVTYTISGLNNGTIGLDVGGGAAVQRSANGTYTERKYASANGFLTAVSGGTVTDGVFTIVNCRNIDGNHVKASNAMMRQDAAGKFYLAFNGVNTVMQTFSAGLPFSQTPHMVIVGGLSNTTGGDILGTGAAGSGNALLSFSGAKVRAQIFRTTLALVDSAANFVLSAPQVVGQVFDGTILSARLNTIATDTGNGGNAVTAAGIVTLGNNDGLTNFLNGRIYIVVMRATACTPVEISDTEAYVNGKTGAY